MSTLYLRIPPQHAGAWPDCQLSYALCSPEGALVREGRSALAQLAETIARSDVVLMIAAADVTLLEMDAPPMSESRLKLALPNLLEDQLMCDTAECVFVAAARPLVRRGSIKNTESGEDKKIGLQGASSSINKRSVAVVQRSWLQQLSTSLFAVGARQIKAVPAQLCLPCQEDSVSARLVDDQHEACANLTLRFDQEHGIGILLAPRQTAEACLEELLMYVPDAPVQLYLPESLCASYQSILAVHPEWAARVTLQVESWKSTINVITTANTIELNLMAGLNVAQKNQIQWQTWRWPLSLALVVIVVNLIGLNGEYWRLKSESQALKQQMTQLYKTSFPNETVVLSPVDQMRKHLEMAQRSSGQPGPDDFTLLLSQFGSVWGSMPPAGLPKLLSIEYKQQALDFLVDGALNRDQIQQNLSPLNLSLEKLSAESWQIRKSK